MTKLAHQLIQENLHTKNTFLDLGNCGLTSIPPELAALQHLEGLNLGTEYIKDNQLHICSNKEKRNQIQELAPLQQLPQLKVLYITENQLTDIQALQTLQQLTTLYLSDNNIYDIQPIQQLNLLTYLNLSDNNIYGIQPIQQLNQLTYLNLHNNNIYNIKPIQQLTQLTHLILSNNNINDIQPIQQLTQLTHLILNNNNIYDIQPIQQLNLLTTLVLKNININDIQPIQQLNLLTYLNLHNNNIYDIQPIQQLNQLTTLVLSNNNIYDIQPIQQLNLLTYLDLGYNNINNIQPIQQLNLLTYLNLHNNNIYDIQPIQQLNLLTLLNLHNNSINDIQPIQQLNQLTTLVLSDNNICDIQPIQQLNQLTTLDLHNNSINDIQPIQQLNLLTYLNLSDNNICDIKALLGLLEKGLDIDISNHISPRIESIDVSNNPLTYPPIEIGRQGREAVLNYFETVRQETTSPIYEAKLLIVGKGGVGKTSLATKLINAQAPLPKVSDTTRGINIQQLTFPINEDFTFTVNMWDFGGQEIQYPTHQFFLTQKSLYILVDDTREDAKTANDNNFKYWLDVVSLYGKNSPLLIVQNEKGGRSKDIDFEGIQTAYPFVKEQLRSNLEKNENLDKLHEVIRRYAQQLPHIGEQLPNSWLAIRTELQDLKKQHAYIDKNEYLRICAQRGLIDPKKALHLSQYLHDIGTFLHFQHNKVLQKFIILQNEWATQPIYAVLTNEQIKQQHGYTSEEELQTIWEAINHHDHFVELEQLLLEFKLCYKLNKPQHTSKHYLIPQLLPESRPEKMTWSYTDNLRLYYDYKFMPKGLLSYLIVDLNSYVEEPEKAWKNGVLFTKEKSHALVMKTYGQNRLEVYVRGKNAKELLVIIAAKIEELSKGIPDVKKQIPCICKECAPSEKPWLFTFTAVQNALEKKANIQCYSSFETLSPKALLENISVIEEHPTPRASNDAATYINYEITNHGALTLGGITQSDIHQGDINQEKIQPPTTLPASTTTPPPPPKKFYQQWWVQGIIIAILGALLTAGAFYWFQWGHPISGLFIGFVLIIVLVAWRGNPERRFFKTANVLCGAALGLLFFQLDFSYKTEQKGHNGNTSFMIESISDYNWLIAFVLLALAGLLFHLDYKNQHK